MNNAPKPFRFGVHVAEFQTGPELINTARMVEDLGYSVFSCPDHLNLAITPMEPMVMLSVVAAVTERIELQPLVLANDFRHPVLLAKAAATLDQLSGGRFSLGIGGGWYGPDFSGPGIKFSSPGVRLARVAEAITILRGLHSGEPFSFQGEYFTVSEMTGTPTPLRAPLPLMVGGSGRKMLSLAASTADTVALNLGVPIGSSLPQSETPFADVTDSKLAWIREAAAERPQPPELQTTVFAGGISAKGTLKPLEPLAQMLKVQPSELTGCPHVLTGSVDQCIDTLHGWRERWGISYITIPGSAAREMAPLVSALHGL